MDVALFVAVSFVAVFLCSLLCEVCYKFAYAVIVITLTAALVLGISVNQEWVDGEAQIVFVQSLNSSQVIEYRDRDNQLQTLNVNRELGETFEEGTRFKVSFYVEGPYFGLYYNNSKPNVRVVEGSTDAD